MSRSPNEDKVETELYYDDDSDLMIASSNKSFEERSAAGPAAPMKEDPPAEEARSAAGAGPATAMEEDPIVVDDSPEKASRDPRKKQPKKRTYEYVDSSDEENFFTEGDRLKRLQEKAAAAALSPEGSKRSLRRRSIIPEEPEAGAGAAAAAKTPSERKEKRRKKDSYAEKLEEAIKTNPAFAAALGLSALSSKGGNETESDNEAERVAIMKAAAKEARRKGKRRLKEPHFAFPGAGEAGEAIPPKYQPLETAIGTNIIPPGYALVAKSDYAATHRRLAELEKFKQEQSLIIRKQRLVILEQSLKVTKDLQELKSQDPDPSKDKKIRSLEESLDKINASMRQQSHEISRLYAPIFLKANSQKYDKEISELKEKLELLEKKMQDQRDKDAAAATDAQRDAQRIDVLEINLRTIDHNTITLCRKIEQHEAGIIDLQKNIATTPPPATPSYPVETTKPSADPAPQAGEAARDPSTEKPDLARS